MVRASFRGVACPRPATPVELDLIRSGDHSTAEVLLRRWEPVVLASARSRARCPASREDIAQAGRLAILDATRNFDCGRGGSFNHYASRAVSNETLKEALRIRAPQDHECCLEAAFGFCVRDDHECRHFVRDWLCSLPRPMLRHRA